MNLHEDIYYTEDLLFVNSTPFFLTLNRKILFTAVNYLVNIKVETILNSFKDIYSYYIKCGFHIATLHLDGEIPPLQAMIYEHMSGVPGINLTSANEHASDIERQVRVIQDRIIAVRHSRPFNKIPKLLSIYIV